MNPVLTELMMRDRVAELQRTSARGGRLDGERAGPRSPRRADRIGTGVFARLRSGSRRRRLLSTRFLGTR
jgi:hypothetical protein